MDVQKNHAPLRRTRLLLVRFGVIPPPGQQSQLVSPPKNRLSSPLRLCCSQQAHYLGGSLTHYLGGSLTALEMARKCSVLAVSQWLAMSTWEAVCQILWRTQRAHKQPQAIPSLLLLGHCSLIHFQQLNEFHTQPSRCRLTRQILPHAYV